jgi:hypothetical protein
LDKRINRTVPLLELHGIERLREEELEEARTIQAVMPPAESLRTKLVTISHEFQPVSVVGGDFLDYFELLDGTIGLYLSTSVMSLAKACQPRSTLHWPWGPCAASTKPVRPRAILLPLSTAA